MFEAIEETEIHDVYGVSKIAKKSKTKGINFKDVLSNVYEKFNVNYLPGPEGAMEQEVTGRGIFIDVRV